MHAVVHAQRPNILLGHYNTTPNMKYITYICFTSAILLAGCATRPCVVQFRGDALGLAGTAPMPPMTDSINGAATSISGTLKCHSGNWVVIEHNGTEVWIPKTAILLIHY
jgi:hypothetical protein